MPVPYLFIMRLKKNVFVLGLVSFFTDFSTEMIYPLLPVFLSVTLGVDKAFIGLIEGIAETTASILKVFSGWFSDRIKKRKLLVGIGYSLSTIAKPLFALAQRGSHVLVIRFSDRVGKGIRTAPRDALIADSTPSDRMGMAFGFHRAMDTLGAVFGPLTAFLLLPLFNDNYRSIFLISFFPAVVAILLIVFFLKEIRPKKITSTIPALSLKSLPAEFKIFLLIMIIFTLGNSSDAFLLLRAQNLGVSMRLIPILWLLFNLVYSIISIPGGMLSDRIGRKRTILIGFIIYTGVYFGFAFAHLTLHIWTLFAIYGIYYGLCEGVMRAYVADLVPSPLRATAFGIYHTAVGLTAFPASLVMGILWQVFSAQIAFSFGAILSLASVILLLVFIRK